MRVLLIFINCTVSLLCKLFSKVKNSAWWKKTPQNISRYLSTLRLLTCFWFYNKFTRLFLSPGWEYILSVIWIYIRKDTPLPQIKKNYAKEKRCKHRGRHVVYKGIWNWILHIFTTLWPTSLNYHFDGVDKSHACEWGPADNNKVSLFLSLDRKNQGYFYFFFNYLTTKFHLTLIWSLYLGPCQKICSRWTRTIWRSSLGWSDANVYSVLFFLGGK